MIVLPKESRAALNWSLWVNGYPSLTAREPKVHLYLNPLPVGYATTLADLLAAEASWPGYAPIPLTGPRDMGPSLQQYDYYLFRECLWSLSADISPVHVGGYWVDWKAAALVRTIAWCEWFPVPVLMEEALNVVALTPRFGIGQIRPDQVIFERAVSGLLLSADAL